MDPIRKKILEELEEMQQQTGRMLRNMAMTSMSTYGSGRWQPPVDVYESETEFYVHFDIAGSDPTSCNVIVDGQQVRVNGQRRLTGHQSIACIHQLEIELGEFDRTIVLPAAVEVDAVTSTYVNGILTVRLPKKKGREKVNIQIDSGDE